MSSSAPTVKDLYKVVTADLAAFLATDKSKEQDTSRETIQSYLDRFVRTHNATIGSHHHVSTSTTPSNPGGLHSTAATPVFGNVSSSVAGAAPLSASNISTPLSASAVGAGILSSSTAAGQRHVNDLLYQSLTNNTILQHSGSLPFAFHRLGHISSNSGSPSSSAPTSQNASTTGSPVIGGGGTGGAQVTTPVTGANAANISASSTTSTTNSSVNISLAAQKLSAHLITLFTQHAMGSTSIAHVTSRVLVYLTHLLPFLTPRLIVKDWWDRIIEPSLQGEIKLSKDALKSCRDLIVECMVRDNLLDIHGSGTGSLLVAGDEEGQLSTVLAKAAMPISQFVLRKYIMAAHDLNHRLPDVERTEQELRMGGMTGLWPRGGVNGSEYAAMLQDMENQQRLFTKTRAIMRRKKDMLVKNLEVILFAYGGGVGRVKDFFSCLYTYFVGARYRPEILGLLCQFIRRQRVHLHQILATPLFDSLLLSLKYDTSPLIVSLGLMTLIMLMPRIPAALNERLPDLFLILSRILCWPRSQQQLMALTNQEGVNLTGQTIKSFDEFDDEVTRVDTALKVNTSVAGSPTKDTGSSPDDIEFEDIPLYGHGIRWRRYGPTVPGSTTEGSPDPTAIFSFLYGLFPCNLLKFLHSPREYIKQALSPAGSPKQSSAPHVGEGELTDSNTDGDILSPKDTDEKAIYIDEDLLKWRVQTLLKRHSLHPELMTLTPEQEILNKARWQKLEPMEIVAMCVGLDVWSSGGLFGTGPVLRSIEEDRRGVPYQDSDDDEANGPPTKVPPAHTTDPTKPTETDPTIAAQSQARASIESFASEESQGTPIEILAREDFFGPRMTKESHLRPTQPMSTPPPHRVHSGQGGISGTPPLPRMRTRSKEVKMSQILRTFATLRGLDQEEYLIEARNSKSLCPSSNPSPTKSNEGSAVTTATATQTNDPGHIPADETTCLTAQSDVTQDYLLHPTTMANLTLQTQEYRKIIAHLERDLLMAKNELNFELFLKQQHIQQISKVHRAHVIDASVEAERQNLYNTCRSLKAQLQETRLLLEKEKSELEKRKNKQTHWDTELKNKMQTFRDERKQLQFEVERLKQNIKDTQQAQEIQERLLTEERKGTFHLKNCLEDLSPNLKKMEEYERRIEEMTRQLVVWDTEQNRLQEMQRQTEIVVGYWQNLELLLAAEKEEARILRNKVSQQSQILDDMRIQMAINGGHEAGDIPQTPSRFHYEEERSDDDDEDDKKERPISRASHLGENGLSADSLGHDDNATEREHSIRRKASSSLRHRASASDMNWPSGYSQSNGSQQGPEQQRRAAAMQEFMVREKERWDRELQEAQYRWSREAMRNQQLEDRIMELLGQVEMTRAINARKHSTVGSSQEGHNNEHHEGRNRGESDHHRDGTTRLIDIPSQPQNVPFAKTTGHDLEMRIHDDHFGEGDTDDGGIESSEMIGRYSRQRHEIEDEEDAEHSSALTTAGHLNPSHPHTSDLSSRPPANSTANKGKNPKQKSSRSKWFSTPAIERSQTGGTTTLQTHLGINTLGILDLGPIRPTQTHRKSGDPSSTIGSSTVAARAAACGLVPPTLYTRHTSHMSDGRSSDITTFSDTNMTGSGARNERRNGDRGGASATAAVEGDEAVGTDSGASDAAAGSSSKAGSVSDSATANKKNSGSSSSSSKSKTDREQEREKERIRLMSGMGPLVDPSKMYRNVRMF
ncbi:hypothetical protein BGZ65_005544 [Modicella reniformis]|uniref:Hamartin n=1 Tax=Modicella reniformis TaxID=1440133 RepID=A0A9P6ML68_9FUNG|nr:hypothetical protein BGZ65_005544 [Modicella reniformis]